MHYCMQKYKTCTLDFLISIDRQISVDPKKSNKTISIGPQIGIYLRKFDKGISNWPNE